MHRNRKRTVAMAALLVVGGGSGVAIAAWNASGTGDAYAKAGTSLPLTTVDVSAATVASLYPGGTGNVRIKVSNPNSYPVTVTDVVGDGAITVSGGLGSCTTHGVTFTDQSGLSVAVPANSSTETTLAGAAAMSNASEDGCREAVFTIPVSLVGASG